MGVESTEDCLGMDRDELRGIIGALRYELKIQRAVVDMAYVPHRSLSQDNDRYRAERDRYRAALLTVRGLHTENSQNLHHEVTISTIDTALAPTQDAQ